MDYPNYLAHLTTLRYPEMNWHYYPGKAIMFDATHNASLYNHIFTPSNFTVEWVTKPKEEQKQQENTPTMKTETVTRAFKLTENSHTEYGMEAKLEGTGSKLKVTGGHGDLKDLFESSKAGDEFLFIVIKQPKAEK